MKSKLKMILLSLGMCAGVFVLAACVSPTPMWESKGDLTASPWVLSRLMDKDPLPNTNITIQFTSDGKVSGSTGCNRYSGTYTTVGSTINISSPMAVTEMACAQEIMDRKWLT